jgi:hypothetical protein
MVAAEHGQVDSINRLVELGSARDARATLSSLHGKSYVIQPATATTGRSWAKGNACWVEGGLTWRSLHFPYGIEGCYVSLENAPADWRRADGSKFPQQMMFNDATWDEAGRRFTGWVDWKGHAEYTRFDYEFTVSADGTRFIKGSCTERKKDGGMVKRSFPKDENYEVVLLQDESLLKVTFTTSHGLSFPLKAHITTHSPPPPLTRSPHSIDDIIFHITFHLLL